MSHVARLSENSVPYYQLNLAAAYLNMISKAHLSYITTFSFFTDKQQRALLQSERKEDAWTVR